VWQHRCKVRLIGSPPRRRRLEPQYPPACSLHQTVSLRLPADLLEAEDQAQQALLEALAEPKQRRWSVQWRFEGLRILPVALRFAQALADQELTPLLVWPDAGAAALARRDGGALASANASLQDVLAGRMDQREGDLLIAVTPQPSDYDTLEQVCERWTGPVVMLNGRLEDAAVGIGSVARARRRGFVATWQVAYWLEPLLPPPPPPAPTSAVSPSMRITWVRTLARSTPRFSSTRAATPSPSRIRPSSRCSVPM